MLVGAAFRLEACLDPRHRAAETAHHVLDRVVRRDADAVGQDLRRHMPVADVPGEPRQMQRVACGDLRDRLLRRDDADHAAVLEHETVAVLELRRLRQIEQEDEIAFGAHGDAPAIAAVMWQHDGVERLRGAGRHHFGCARCGQDFSLQNLPAAAARIRRSSSKRWQ